MNRLPEMIPVGDTTANFKRLIKILYGRVSKMNVPLENRTSGYIWPSTAFSRAYGLSSSVGHLAITLSRPFAMRNEESVQRTST